MHIFLAIKGQLHSKFMIIIIIGSCRLFVVKFDGENPRLNIGTIVRQIDEQICKPP